MPGRYCWPESSRLGMTCPPSQPSLIPYLLVVQKGLWPLKTRLRAGDGQRTLAEPVLDLIRSSHGSSLALKPLGPRATFKEGEVQG
jgi:hypothetical protein